MIHTNFNCTNLNSSKGIQQYRLNNLLRVFLMGKDVFQATNRSAQLLLYFRHFCRRKMVWHCLGR